MDFRAVSEAQWQFLPSLRQALDLVPESTHIYEQIHLIESTYKLNNRVSENCFKLIQTQGEGTR